VTLMSAFCPRVNFLLPPPESFAAISHSLAPAVPPLTWRHPLPGTSRK
jgi:hypothetical protein